MKKINLMLLIFGALAFASCESNEPNYNGYNGGSGSNSGSYSSGKKPVASFTYENTQPLGAYFYNKSQNATSFKWEIDGKVVDLENFRYTFKSKGVYRVKLTAYNDLQSDTYETNVTIVEPTKCYFAGITYNNLDLKVFNKYIWFKLIDDDILTTTWVTSTKELISSANLPFEYIFKKKVLLDGLSQDNWYKIQVFYSDKSNGNGTLLDSFQFLTSELNKFPTGITWDAGGAIGSKNSITAHFIWE